MRWDRIANCLEHRDGILGVTEEVSPTVASLDLLDRAREVDIDHFVSHADQNQRTVGHLAGMGSHDLAGDRMVVETRRDIVFDLAHAALGG
ncbi:MAG: hypothetical protein SGJ11_05115 [Phycisphaerae bacterium]|nr:hypothetical protein [Phycisphaerae bacterium]